MPLYEYECEKGHRFEKIQKFSDPLIDTCPTCGSPVHKLMSSPAIQFKGSGWYITDYARKDSVPAKNDAGEGSSKDADKNKSGETKSESTSDAQSREKSGSKSESKSDAKSDAKADTKPATPKT